MDIMNLLDSTLEDLADLQKFEPLLLGSYRLSVGWDTPEDEEYVIVNLKLSMLEVLQIPGIDDPEKFPAVGKAATFYMRLQRKDGEPMVWKDGTTNTQDQGRFKEVLQALAPVFNPDGSLTNRQMMEASEGAEVVATLGVRASKKDPESKFNFIKLIAAA